MGQQNRKQILATKIFKNTVGKGTMTNQLWFNLIVGFKFYFHLFQTHYHTLPYLKKQS